MRTWKTLAQHIRSNYVITEETDDMVAVLCSLQDERRQVVFVRKLSVNEAEWAEIATPVCVESDVPPRDALEMNADLAVGGLALLKSGTVVYRHSFPLKDLDPDEFDVPFRLIVAKGDELEYELTGGDRF